MSRLFLTVAACLFIVGCSSPPAAPIRSEAAASRAYLGARNLPSHGVALEGYCPVAYHAVNAPVRGRPEFTTTHDGVTYWFVSADAKDAFDVDPAKYLPAYGGWCAFGMSIEDKFPVDPTSFLIVDGRLMVFLNNDAVDARALWLAAEDDGDLVARADRHWRVVQG